MQHQAIQKHKAIEIRIEFSESAVHQRRGFSEKHPKVFTGGDCWILAQAYLNDLAHHGPKTGGYDKTDVVVKFSDGYEYDARLDIQHFDGKCPDHRLAEHIRNFCRFYGGLLKENEIPSHMTPADYAIITIGLGQEDFYRTFLDKYEVPTNI